jgi:hypothetical protein
MLDLSFPLLSAYELLSIVVGVLAAMLIYRQASPRLEVIRRRHRDLHRE